MSSRRKHVTHGLSQEIEAPKDGERIVRAIGSRGGNIVEVIYVIVAVVFHLCLLQMVLLTACCEHLKSCLTAEGKLS